MVHWDGKLLPEITGRDKVDRLPIVVTQEDTEQLLAVPKLSSGTGNSIATNVFEQLNQWQLLDKVQAACFDTTASNTGEYNGAAVLLEELLHRSLLFLPCRHHIYELVLKDVFIQKVLGSKTVGPDIPLIGRFRNEWNDFEQSFFNYGITDSIVKKHIPQKKAEEIKNFCLHLMTKDICRDDYREFLELTVMFLGFKLPSGDKFRPLGPSHHARWMAKAIYAMKIFMFRDQFVLSESELNGIRDVCIFLVLLYVKAWFTCNSGVDAPNNDLQFVKSAIQYSKIDSEISNIVITKMSNHLWYLATESVAFSFLDNTVTVNEKRKMVAALKKEKTSCKRIIATPSEIVKSFKSKSLNDFVCSDTKHFFERFGLKTDFFDIDPSAWPTIDSYNDAVNFCHNIKVVNDTAERFVQLFTSYNLILSKDEAQKQFIIQVVNDYTSKYPSSNKSRLA